MVDGDGLDGIMAELDEDLEAVDDAPDSGDPDEPSVATEEVDETPEDEDAESTPDSDVSEAPSEDAPAAELDGTQTPEAPAAPEPNTEALLAAYQRQTQILNELQVEKQRLEQERQAAEAEALITELNARWEEMDPDDAHAEQVQFINGLHEQRLQAERAKTQSYEQQRIMAQNLADKQRAIPIAMKKWGLKTGDEDYLALARNGDELDQIGSKLQKDRQAQTAAARAAKAEKAKGNPALRSGPTGKPAQAPEKDYDDLDEYLDDLLAG